MSSFGSRSVGSRTQDERGAHGTEREGAGPDFGAEAGERGVADGGGGSGAAGGDAAALPADAPEVRGGGRRGRGSRPARSAIEPVAAGRGSGAGDGRRGGSAVPGLRADAACRAPGANLRPALERGDVALLDAGGRTMAAAACEAPAEAGAACGAGGAGPVGQLGAPVAGGPGGGVRADLDPRRRDEPPDDGAVRRARRRGGEPAGDHRIPAAARPPSGRVHRPRGPLRAVAVSEGGADGHDHRSGAGRAGPSK